MMYVINFGLMLFCIASLIWFLLKTRGHDTLSWWGLRTCLVHALICVVYMSYEAYQAWQLLPTNLLFIRLGFVSMIFAMLLMWHLLRKQKADYNKSLFNLRIKQIFDKD